MLCTEVESLQEVVKQVERRQDGIGSVARAGDDHLQFRPYCIFVSLCFSRGVLHLKIRHTRIFALVG